MNATRTPGPWRIRYSEDRADAFIERGDRSDITDIQSRLIAQCFMHDLEDAANAAFIVRAVNSHADLVAALELIAGADNVKDGTFVSELHFVDELQGIARAALAAAKAQP